MIAATLPIQRSAEARLLVLDRCGHIAHASRAMLARWIGHGDLVIANDAATIPASLAGRHGRTGSVIEVRLAARAALGPAARERYTALVFGAGDFRTPTEFRPVPPELRAGDVLSLGSLQATVVTVRDPRLVDIRFAEPPARVWEGLAREGRPIQYAHVPSPLAIWDTWTRIANRPVAFEAPSAGFVIDWSLLATLRARGAAFATITLAAGLSSTGDPALDALLPLDEAYEIPARTAALVRRTYERGGRVVAIGTSVVRALEHAALRRGRVRAGAGLATSRISESTRLRAVDAIVSGTHEPGTSHYELLRAFQPDLTLRQMDRELERAGYRTHEFGDSVLIEARRTRDRCCAESHIA